MIPMFQRGNSKVVLVESQFEITDVESAVDLVLFINHMYGCDKIAVSKDLFAREFFDLSSGLANKIIVEWNKYGVRVALFGDFSEYRNRSLIYFMNESNKRERLMFLPDKLKAVDRLHKADGC